MVITISDNGLGVWEIVSSKHSPKTFSDFKDLCNYLLKEYNQDYIPDGLLDENEVDDKLIEFRTEVIQKCEDMIEIHKTDMKKYVEDSIPKLKENLLECKASKTR